MDREDSTEWQQEREVKKALFAYKMALVSCHYRNWWHRLLLWCRAENARGCEQQLVEADAKAEEVCNRSEVHQKWLKLVIDEQPVSVREEDNFAKFLKSSTRTGQ